MSSLIELARAKCPRGDGHRVWIDGRKVYVADSAGSRRCANPWGPDARDAAHAMAIAQSFLVTLCEGRG